MTTKSKLKEDNESIIATNTKTEQKDKPKPMIDFMPGWDKEEKCKLSRSSSFLDKCVIMVNRQQKLTQIPSK